MGVYGIEWGFKWHTIGYNLLGDAVEATKAFNLANGAPMTFGSTSTSNWLTGTAIPSGGCGCSLVEAWNMVQLPWNNATENGCNH